MRFLVIHPLEAGTTRERLTEFLREIPPEIKEYRSFINLTEGKGVCLLDAPDREVLVKWLDERKLPYDAIWMVEAECKHGEFIDILSEADVST